MAETCTVMEKYVRHPYYFQPRKHKEVRTFLKMVCQTILNGISVQLLDAMLLCNPPVLVRHRTRPGLVIAQP